MSDEIAALIIYGLIFAGAVIFLCIIGTLIGMFVGFVVSIIPFINSTVEVGLQSLGLDARGHLMQIGGALGFISGFFSGVVKVVSEKNGKSK